MGGWVAGGGPCATSLGSLFSGALGAIATALLSLREGNSPQIQFQNLTKVLSSQAQKLHGSLFVERVEEEEFKGGATEGLWLASLTKESVEER